MGNFKVDPATVRDVAKKLEAQVVPAYQHSATTLHDKGHVDSPAFGIALSLVGAAYDQRLDFMQKDVQGAHDVVHEIASRLNQTADEYDKGENLNVKGFDGKGLAEKGYGSALGGALGDALPGGIAAAGLEVGILIACEADLATCAGLCPTFIPAALAIPLFICNIPSIFHAGGALTGESRHIKGVLNASFDALCSSAADDWEGEGATNFQLLQTKIKGHMDDLADYISTVGTTIEVIAGALVALWLGLLALAVPFLVWLIAMRVAEASPPWLQDAVLEPIIEAAGVTIGTTILTTLASVETAGAAVAALLSSVGSALIGAFNVPDAGKEGVPDMQEFHVDQNYKSPL